VLFVVSPLQLALNLFDIRRIVLSESDTIDEDCD